MTDTPNATSRPATLWVVRTDQPFTGNAESVLLPNGTVAYSGGLTPDQYARERGIALKIVDDAEFFQMIAQFEDGLVEDPTEETSDDFDYALGVLPPRRWKTLRGVELFHVSEAVRGDLVHWHARVEGRFFTFVDRMNAAFDTLVEKVIAANRTAIREQA